MTLFADRGPASGSARSMNARTRITMLGGESVPADDGEERPQDGQESQHESVTAIGLLHDEPLKD